MTTCCSSSGATRSRSCCRESRLRVEITTTAEADEVRTIAISAAGAGWVDRVAELEAAVMPWTVPA